MELFGVGIGEAGLVLLITLLVVGPERFPQIAREGGKYYRMARRFTAEVTGDLRTALNELENEVKEQTGDLKAVREISEEVRAGVAESATDIDSISRATSQAASGDAAPPETAPPASADPFARVTASYSDYHTPASTAAPANIEGAPEVAPEVDGDELSRQAVEAFDEFRKPAAPASEAAPAPYSPQSIVGVNPFASADPPVVAPTAPPTSFEEPTQDEETEERASAASTSTPPTLSPSSTRAPGA